METRSRSRSSSKPAGKDGNRRAPVSRSPENRTSKTATATRRSSSKSAKEDKNKGSSKSGSLENRSRKRSVEVRSSKSTGKDDNKGAMESGSLENRGRKKSVEARSSKATGKDDNKGAMESGSLENRGRKKSVEARSSKSTGKGNKRSSKPRSQENTSCLTAVERRSMVKKHARAAKKAAIKNLKSAARSSESDEEIIDLTRDTELKDERNKGVSKSSHQEATPCLVVVEKLNMETRSKNRASIAVSVKMDEAIENLESGKDKSKEASTSCDVEMAEANENVDLRKGTSGGASGSAAATIENKESEEDTSDSDSEPDEGAVMKELEELMKKIELGEISYEEACEMVEKRNAQLEEFIESELKRSKELAEEEKQLDELLNTTSSQAKLIANTDFVGEQQDEVAKQSALLDSLYEKICHHIRDFLDDEPSQNSSSSRNKESKKSVSDVLHLLIPGLRSGTMSTEEVVLKTDESMKDALDILLSANVVEVIPGDTTCVKLCNENFLDMH